MCNEAYIVEIDILVLGKVMRRFLPYFKPRLVVCLNFQFNMHKDGQSRCGYATIFKL